MHDGDDGRARPPALSMLTSERPRNVGWRQAAGLLFGDWGTSRLYVLGLAFLFAGRSSFYLIVMMSLLIVGVGWAYTQICRIYPDGGGVYTAAKHRSQLLAVIGALLLFADYTVTASLSALDGFHYFGLPLHKPQWVARATEDAGDKIILSHENTERSPLDIYPSAALPADLVKAHRIRFNEERHELIFVDQMSDAERDELLAVSADPAWRRAVTDIYDKTQSGSLFAWDSPGLWAMVAIALIGLFNLMGPKHTGSFAIFAAVGMVLITLAITVGALVSGHIDWRQLPHRIGSPYHNPGHLWIAFVSIVLALSGVEAVANLTGVMRRPVTNTSRKAIWVVALEVAIFNIVLMIFMLAIYPVDREAHVNDMLAFLSGQYLGGWGEWGVRIVGGLLLLSAANTAITDMISVQYLMARDGELPQIMVTLNRFGVPWIPAILAAFVPILVLGVSHNLENLAALYAIGVIGAVAINITLCAIHPRLRSLRRKIPMFFMGTLLLAIWITLAFTKLHALVFVCIVMAVGLSARQITKWLARRKGAPPSLLRKAIQEQLTLAALTAPKLLVGTYGSEGLAPLALAEAKRRSATLVVCFIRQVQLSYKYEYTGRLTIETDLAALRTFRRFLDLAQSAGVVIIPVYDSGPDAAELIAEQAAMHACSSILIGTSRHGAMYHLIKGGFQQRLEQLLPPDIQVEVLAPADPSLAEHDDAGPVVRSQ